MAQCFSITGTSSGALAPLQPSPRTAPPLVSASSLLPRNLGWKESQSSGLQVPRQCSLGLGCEQITLEGSFPVLFMPIGEDIKEMMWGVEKGLEVGACGNKTSVSR